MSLTKLPKNWCVQRTKENYQVVNAYFNGANGNPPSAYTKSDVSYMPYDLKRGVKGPSSTLPSGYTLITFQQFMDWVVNGNAGAPSVSSLPTYWAVLNDKTEAFQQIVIPYFNSLRDTSASVTGSSNSYYGFDGEAVVRSNLAGFSREVTVLTVDQFNKAINGQNSTSITRNPIARNTTIEAVPTKAPSIMDYKVKKAYPGMPVGTLASAKGISLTSPIVGETEYWEPITGIRYEANDYIVLLNRNHSNVVATPGKTYRVVRISSNTSNIEVKGSQILDLETGASASSCYSNEVRIATPEEIAQLAYPEINNMRCVPTGQGTINIGVVSFNQQELQAIKKLKVNLPNSIIKIGTTNITEDLIDELLEQLDN